MQISARFPYSVLLIGSPGGAIPEGMAGLATATDSCVAVGTLAAPDGETTVRLLDADSDRQPGGGLVFDGTVGCSGRIAILSVEGETHLEMPVDGASARVRIWANHRSEPDAIDVLVASADGRADSIDDAQPL